MKEKLIGAALISLLLIVGGGLVYATVQNPAQDQVQKAEATGYICPVTGDELPCAQCCPLSN